MKKLYIYVKSHKILSTFFIILIFLLSFSIKLYKFNYKYNSSENTTRMEVIVQNLEKIEEDKISYLVKYNNDKFILNVYNNKYSKNQNDIKKYSSYKYGDVISFRGKIKIPEKLGNPYEFDYKKYLNSKNIIGTITTYDIKLVDVKAGNLLIKKIYNIKEKISNRLDNIMPNTQSNLFKSMLYGDDRFLEKNIQDDFEKSGLTHLLAVSGSNIAMLMMIVSYICKKLNKTISVIFTITVSSIFCIFCSFELSIIRASIFLVITNMYKYKENKINVYLKIFFTFLVMVIYNPYCIFNIGMIMSYLSVLSIIIFQNQIFSLLDNFLKGILNIKYMKPKKLKKIIYKFLYLIIYPFSFTLSVQILLFPIQIYFFNSFYLISFLSNIVISYIDSIFCVIGFLTVMLSYVPCLSEILANTSFLVLKVIIYLANFFSKYEWLNLKLATPDIFSILTYYFIIVIFNIKKYILFYTNKRYKKYMKIVIKIVIIVCVIYILFSYIYFNYVNNYVIYFNVEQGNMALIHYKKKNVIVDMGSTTENLASNILVNFLTKKNIKKIDAVILTHFHTDHINGINDYLLNNIKIKKVIYARPKEEQKEYIEIMNILNKNNISKLEVTKDEDIEIGNIKIKIISPSINFKIKDEDVANANSIVSIISVSNKNFMFMGDATKSTEENILKNNNINIYDIDSYQVGHHRIKDIYFR